MNPLILIPSDLTRIFNTEKVQLRAMRSSYCHRHTQSVFEMSRLRIYLCTSYMSKATEPANHLAPALASLVSIGLISQCTYVLALLSQPYIRANIYTRLVGLRYGVNPFMASFEDRLSLATNTCMLQ